MIVLRDFLSTDKVIKILNNSFISSEKKGGFRNGVGGFTDENELVGIYVLDDKFYFQYNKNSFESKPNEIICTNEIIDKGKRRFIVNIKNERVCDIVYEPYVNPLAIIFGDDEDEFDVLLYISRILKNEDTIISFINGMKLLNS